MNTPVVDFHYHVGSMGRAGLPAKPDLYLRVMDAAGVDRACINGAIHGDAKRGNDLVASFVDRHPDRFIPVAFVSPHYGDEAVGELERCFDELGAKFLKIYADFLGRPHDDPVYFPTFEFCDDRGLAVLHHASYPFDPKTLHLPDRYRALHERFPNVVWVLAHAGAGNRWDAVETAREVPNVYLETAARAGPAGSIERVVAAVGADRVLYGSDMPVFDARHQVGRIVTADISEQDKRKILGLNAIRLLDLDS